MASFMLSTTNFHRCGGPFMVNDIQMDETGSPNVMEGTYQQCAEFVQATKEGCKRYAILHISCADHWLDLVD